MTKPRSQLIDLESTSYYHCISRCVRRAFLWGEDHLTGRNYGHRKQWVIDRLSQLDDIFAIDICAYAVMSNHYHLVLRVDSETAAHWSEDIVIDRWSRLFSIPLLIARYQKGNTSPAESNEALKIINTWRERLTSISWYMRSLNEHLARKANQEDNCNGRFWEGRFKSQALLDEAAVLTCMSYVDLNPIRAGIAQFPEDSDFTSIQQRIMAYQPQDKTRKQPTDKKLIALVNFDKKAAHHPQAFAYGEQAYMVLVDWAGRAIRDDKRGFIPSTTPPLLERLGIPPEQFLSQMKKNSRKLSHATALGCYKKLKTFATRTGRQRVRGLAVSL